MPHKLLKGKEYFDEQYEKMKQEKADSKSKPSGKSPPWSIFLDFGKEDDKYIPFSEYLSSEKALIDEYVFSDV